MERQKSRRLCPEPGRAPSCCPQGLFSCSWWEPGVTEEPLKCSAKALAVGTPGREPGLPNSEQVVSCLGPDSPPLLFLP